MRIAICDDGDNDRKILCHMLYLFADQKGVELQITECADGVDLLRSAVSQGGWSADAEQSSADGGKRLRRLPEPGLPNDQDGSTPRLAESAANFIQSIKFKT